MTSILSYSLLALVGVGIPPARGPEVENLGLAATGLQTKGTLFAFPVGEAAQGGGDLNGDGDTLDDVLHVFDARAGSVRNLGLQVHDYLMDERFVALNVFERSQGMSDRNGDGDTDDFVLHVFDADSGMTHNLGLAGLAGVLSVAAGFTRNSLFFGVDESSQGMLDLNGDGDADDFVLHRLDLRSGAISNLGLALFPSTIFSPLRVVGACENTVALLVSEGDQGATDLNGDGDTTDLVLHVRGEADGILHNLRLALPGVPSQGFDQDGGLLAFNVSEADQGAADLNGDGDAEDSVAHMHELDTSATTNLRLAGIAHPLASPDGELLAFVVWEADQGGTDLNGDADADDWVLHVHDVVVRQTGNVRLAGRLPRFLTGRRRGHGGPTPISRAQARPTSNVIVFDVDEAQQAGVDLNSDGDALDLVLHLVEPATGAVTNTALASADSSIAFLGDPADGSWLAFRGNEAAQGADLNGDGDADDFVVHLFDARSRTVTDLRLATFRFDNFLFGSELALEDRVLVFSVEESGQATLDRNGDDDTLDDVLAVHDTRTGRTRNLRLAMDPQELARSGRYAAVLVRETDQAGTDLNGDGDALDEVVHVVDLEELLPGDPAWTTSPLPVRPRRATK